MIKEIRYSEFIEERPIHREWIDDHGREVLSSKPVSIPLQVAPPASSMAELIHQLYRSMKAQNEEVESFEDANDFDVPDELGLEMRNTPYEQDFDHVEVPAEPAPQPSPVPAEPDKPKEVAS